MKTAADSRNPKHAPRLLYEMCRASQDGLTPSEWLKLAERKSNLRETMKAYCPKALTARALAHALRALVDKELAYEGERFTLHSKWVNCEHTTRYGVASPLRETILKQRAAANAREARIQADAFEIAKRLRRGLKAPALVLPIAPESGAERSRREVLEETKRAGWFTPLQQSERTAAPVPAPPAIAEPQPAPPTPPPVDSSLPKAWQLHGKPDYSPRQFETADDRFHNDRVRQLGKARAVSVELASFVFDPKNQHRRDE
jgi:hypothetical protein